MRRLLQASPEMLLEVQDCLLLLGGSSVFGALQFLSSRSEADSDSYFRPGQRTGCFAARILRSFTKHLSHDPRAMRTRCQKMVPPLSQFAPDASMANMQHLQWRITMSSGWRSRLEMKA